MFTTTTVIMVVAIDGEMKEDKEGRKSKQTNKQTNQKTKKNVETKLSLLQIRY